MMHLLLFSLVLVIASSSVNDVKEQCYCRVDCCGDIVGENVKSLDAKVEGLINKASGVSDAVRALEAKMENLIPLNNKTSDIDDAVNSLETKMENLMGLKK